MGQEIRHIPDEKHLQEGLKRDALNVAGEFRLFERNDTHTLVLVSFGPDSAAAERFRRGEEASTHFPGYHSGTVEWECGSTETYRVRLLSGGTSAFDQTLSLSALHAHILDWYGGRPAFDGAI